MDIDTWLDHLFYAIGARGAESAEEISQRLSSRVGSPAPLWRVHGLLGCLRDNRDEYDWNVIMAKRGPTVPGQVRYIRYMCDGSGGMIFDNERNRQLAEVGQFGSVSHGVRMLGHCGSQFKEMAALTRSRTDRELYLGLSEDLEAVMRKSRRVASIIELRRNGTEG